MQTNYIVVSVAISFDSTVAITITKNKESEYWINMYDLTTSLEKFREKIGGNKDSYIKLKEVAQNEKGDKYAIVYFDDGVFKLRNFT